MSKQTWEHRGYKIRRENVDARTAGQAQICFAIYLNGVKQTKKMFLSDARHWINTALAADAEKPALPNPPVVAAVRTL